DLCEPAIAYADRGFAVSPTIATLWQKGSETLKDQPGFSDHFMPGGRAPQAGETFRCPATAHTLRLIAETRGAAFYTGALAEQIEAEARRHGAVLTAADMAA